MVNDGGHHLPLTKGIVFNYALDFVHNGPILDLRVGLAGPSVGPLPGQGQLDASHSSARE